MKLRLVGLPLGNIEDISLRAIRVLREAKLVICEDTRVFRKLWLKLEGSEYIGKLEVINEFNENSKVLNLAVQIASVEEAVLVSDSGMPVFSDPGFKLVQQVLQMGGEVTSVPGPTALTTAICLSGLSSDKVLFLGFLPKKKSKREKHWNLVKSLSGLGLTVAIYEPARSALKTLEEVRNNFGKVEVVIARELTKKYEEIIRGTVEEVMKKIKENVIKGELVLLWRLPKQNLK